MATLKEAAAYAGELRKTLFLRGWEINYARMDGETNIAAECTPDEQYRRAYIRLHPPFFKEELAAQKEIILHELCHIITGPQNHLITKLREGILVTPSEQSEAFERTTSWITGVVAALL